MRPHLSLNVRDVPASVEFYQKVFGVPPQKQTVDYAKFDLTEPALNFSLVSAAGTVSRVNHLGIEVRSADDMAVWKQRLQDQGILEKVEDDIACCDTGLALLDHSSIRPPNTPTSATPVIAAAVSH